VDSRTPAQVIGIAASAGGLEAVRRVVADLPADLPAAVCVVLHIPPTGRSMLASILERDGPLHAVAAEHGQPLRRGTIYVAPADRHLLVRRDRVELSAGPKENGVRPAADPLFRSLATAWGTAGIAIVLSGALGDGSAGAAALAAAGGTVIVQDPADAIVPSMPQRTIEAISPHHTVPSSEIATLLEDLTRQAARLDGVTK
jgi:two-component system chemotaxis response regulator CheB